MAEPHEILGVDPDASADEIGEAFRTLAQIYHPDKYMGAPPKVQEEANRRMKEVAAAHQAMMDALKNDLVYRTHAWSNQRKAETTNALLDAGVPHSWDGDYLRVARQHKKIADSLVLRRPSTGATVTKNQSQEEHVSRGRAKYNSKVCRSCGKAVPTSEYRNHVRTCGLSHSGQ